MTKISAFIICRNEAETVERALKSLHFADEIIVVDGESSDATVEIAKKYTDNVFVRPAASSFGDERNFGLQKCSHPWVFFLDADEVVSPELAQWMLRFKSQTLEASVKDSLPTPSEHPLGAPKTDRTDLFEIRRIEHFHGRRYCFGAHNPSHQWRFFRREGSQFVGKAHEYPVFEGQIRRLEYPVLHLQPGDLHDMMRKVNRAASLAADQLFERGVVKGPTYMFFSGLAQFLKAYFRKQGFRDGVFGFILAVLDGTEFFLKQSKLFEKNRRAGKV